MADGGMRLCLRAVCYRRGAACAEGGNATQCSRFVFGGLGLTLLEGGAAPAPGLFLDGQVGNYVGWCVGVEGGTSSVSIFMTWGCEHWDSQSTVEGGTSCSHDWVGEIVIPSLIFVIDSRLS
jgi:hypothetical protein